MENVTLGNNTVPASRANSVDRTGYHEDRLLELRQELDRVAAEWKIRVGEGAARGVEIGRETIQYHPWATVTLAAVIGAIAAIALVPPRKIQRPKRVQTDNEERRLNGLNTHQSRAETRPLSARFAQAWDSIASLNATTLPSLSSSSVPSFETIAGLAKSLWNTK